MRITGFTKSDGEPKSGKKKLAALAGDKITRPDAEFVRQQTGFVIGGVPPIRHRQALGTWIDADLLGYTELWAAAGHPAAVFRLTPAELVEMTGGTVVEIRTTSIA